MSDISDEAEADYVESLADTFLEKKPLRGTLTPTQRAEKMVQTMLLGTGDNRSYFDHFLSQIEEVYKDGFSAGAREMREMAAKRLHELGEEKYPKAIFQDKAGTFARHLLEDVLPDEIRALKTPEGGK